MKKLFTLTIFLFTAATLLCTSVHQAPLPLSNPKTSTLAPFTQAAQTVSDAHKQSTVTEYDDDILANAANIAEIIAADIGSMEKFKEFIDNMRYDGIGIILSPMIKEQTKERLKTYFLKNQDEAGFIHAEKNLFTELTRIRDILNIPTKSRSMKRPEKADSATTMAWALAQELMGNGWFLDFIEELHDFDVGTVYSSFLYNEELRDRLFWYFKRNHSRHRLKKATKELRLILEEIYLAYHETIYSALYHEEYILTAA